MLVGIREVYRGLFHIWKEHISSDGVWWILALDGLLLIPLIFAAFFFPLAVVAILGGAALVMAVALGLRRLFNGRHPHDSSLETGD